MLLSEMAPKIPQDSQANPQRLRARADLPHSRPDPRKVLQDSAASSREGHEHTQPAKPDFRIGTVRKT